MLTIVWGLITSKAGKYLLAAGGILLALWLGYRAMEGHFREKEVLRQYQRADEVRKEDKKTDEKTNQEKERINHVPPTQFDFDAELKRLRDHARQGQD